MFAPDFLAWPSDYRLPEYELHREDGQWALAFQGAWADVTLWELPALTVLSELRSREALRGMGRFELDVLYARAKSTRGARWGGCGGWRGWWGW